MKFSSLVITVFLLCAIFFFLGFFSFSKFYNMVLPDVYGVRYQMDLVAVEDTQTVFAIIAGLMPLLLFFTWQLIPLYSTDKKTSTVFIIIICMALAAYIRHKMLVSHFEEMVESLTNKNAGPSVPFSFEELYFEYYLLGGLISGCVISYLIFHNKVIKGRTMLNIK